MSSAVDLTTEQAADALRGAAFTVTDEDSSDHGRTLIHCFLGSFGADWDLDSALALLGRAERVAWADHMFRHDLAIVADGRTHWFDVQRPERSQ